MNRQLHGRIVELLAETGRAHREAFAHRDGDDPDWPIWYAERLQPELSGLLGRSFTRSELVHCLLDADDERRARAPELARAEFFASCLLEHYAPAENPGGDNLALYQFPACPYCRLVSETIDRLGLDVERRDIHRSERYWDELVAARGRSTVPVLRIEAADGDVRWMPESRDIVRYLEQTYG